MKKIVKIAKLELSVLFYSPIAWLLLVIFLIQAGLTYTDMLYSQETQQQLGRRLNVLTKVFFAGENGVLASVQRQLYLYIPLLTMGLMSREISSGSIKLLYSSPITISQIILGKYLSMMLYNLALVGILLIFIPISIFSIENVDILFILGGIFGLYLLMCAYAAIGLFMSSLTSYQVVAAISTLAVLAMLNFVGTVGQEYDRIRDITYWFSISGRANNFVNGLISSKDLIYFILVIVFFLILSIVKLNNEHQTKTKAIKIIQYSALIIAMVVIGYVSSLPTINGYLDTTRFKDRTLTKNSQDIVKKLDKPISIRTYVNVIDYSAQIGAPKNRIKDLAKFENFRRFLPHLKMDYIYYYDKTMYDRDTTKTLIEKAKKAARVLHIDFDKILPPSEIKKQVDLLPENSRLVRFINYDGKSIPLRMFNDIFRYPNERDISSKLKTLIEIPARVGILTGNGERDTYKKANSSYTSIIKGVNVRNSLINKGFDVLDIDLNKKNIPLDLDVLVIADPKYNYTEEQLDKINEYIDNSGNLLIAGEPRRQDILNPIVKKLGVRFEEGVLLQESKNHKLDLIKSIFTAESKKTGFSFRNEAKVPLAKATHLTYTNTSEYDITPILITNKKFTWNKLGTFDLNMQKVEFDSILEKKMEFLVAITLTKNRNKRKQKIIVISDADFMSNGELNRNNVRNNVNSSFILKMFKWFSNDRYYVSTARPKAIDKKIKITRAEINWLKVIVLGIIPLFICLFGVILLIKRRQN